MTEKAKMCNWEDYTWVENNKPPETTIGLKNIAQKIIPELEIVPIIIEEEQIETNNWDLFQKIFDIIEPGDEIYFDITHSFRSFPILALTILNYSRFLKGCKLGRILYGNFETKKNECSVIEDHSGLISLLDWTNGVERFINTGDASIIKNLTSSYSYTDNNKEEIKQLKELAKCLDKLSQTFQTCRGRSISKTYKKLKEELDKTKKINARSIQPLVNLLNKIEEKIDSFSGEEVNDGFEAAVWCKEHRLIQQGFTLLQEMVITGVCKALDLRSNIYNDREIVSSTMYDTALKIIYKKPTKIKFKEKDLEKSNKVRDFIYPVFLNNNDLAIHFINLKKFRNNINHADMIKNSESINYLQLYEELIASINALKPFFEDLKKQPVKGK